ncbi:G-protein coupled receptor 20 [Acipenser ruthenus]|uniref:G-protein coupled receptor 20 n=1 Tax=Acipenser ruthenus TaxID=7906 RepID=A0A444UUX8_ACIRT|nr:G-protein coupled receptor 20-like [Acipenser ruthenus]RXM91981.1 G-protein coupled receptor 20 [Acipenser ruthenus]
MQSTSTEGNYFPSMTPVPTHNLSSQVHKDSYLHKLALLDKALYNDFYSLWIALIVINVLIFLMGILLNSLALYIFCFRTKSKTTSVIYTINLVITDLLVGFSLPTRIIMYYSGGDCLTCSLVHIFSYFVNMYCSILFLTCICVDRYLAIVQVEVSHKWRSQNYAKGICIFIWLFAIVVTYSILITAIKYATCCLSKLFALTVFEFLVPLIIIVVSTVRIMCALSSSDRMQQSRQRRMRAVQLLVTVLVIFMICFTPFHIRQVLVYAYPDIPRHVSLIIYHVTVTLSSLNSCMDPIVYCFVTNNFQSTMKGIFRKPEAEQTSRDIASMQKSSKGSGTAIAVTNTMTMNAWRPPLHLQGSTYL